ncbi:MAG: protein O-mannosyl-transferase family [Caldilineaceae bacterium]
MSTPSVEKILIDKPISPTANQVDKRPLPFLSPPTRWLAFLLLLAALTLYGATLDNGFQPGELEGGDLITHQYAQVQARPSNAPGYPLYTMGGWLWFHGLRSLFHAAGVALPNPISLLSSYSTLWALLALWLLYKILCRLTRTLAQPLGDGWLAALLCAFYGVTYFFWYYATATEQYSSAIAQTLAIVYFYWRWQEAEETNKTAGQPVPALWGALPVIGLAFLSGLSLAHMLTVAFIVPPLVIVILWQAPYLLRSFRVVIGAVIAALIPLVSYLYVYWRGAAHPEWWGAGDWATPQAWFWAFVSTAQGREELGWGLGPTCTFFANGFPQLIWQELSLPVLLIGLIGLALLKRRQPFLLYSTCVIYLIFCWAYRCGNWFQVILPVYPLLLLGVAAFIQRLRQQRWGRFCYATAMTLLVVAIGWRFTASLAAADSRNRPTDSAFDQAAILLAQPLPDQAALFAAVHDALALQYLSAIWQVRPDVWLVDSREAAQQLAAGQSVYSTWEAAPTLRVELPPDLITTQQASDPYWIKFDPTGPPVPLTPATLLNRTVLTDVVLLGYDLTAVASSPLADYRLPIAVNDGELSLTLFWQLPASGWPTGVSLSVRPQQGGQPVPDSQGGYWQEDRQQPAVGLYTLLPGQPIADPYRLPAMAGATGTIDQVQILLYRATATGFENLAEVLLPVMLRR